jgi:hypothetical protein
MIKKIIIISIGIIIVAVTLFFVYANIMGIASKTRTYEKLTPELIKLEKQIQKETHDKSSRIELIAEDKIEDCQDDKFDQTVVLNNNNESINLDIYTKDLSEKIKKILPHKECTDSIIIRVYNFKDDKKYRYSFPAE